MNIQDIIYQSIRDKLREELKEELKKEILEDISKPLPKVDKTLSKEEKQKIYNERWRAKKGREYMRQYMRTDEQKQKSKIRYQKYKEAKHKDKKDVIESSQLIIS